MAYVNFYVGVFLWDFLRIVYQKKKKKSKQNVNYFYEIFYMVEVSVKKSKQNVAVTIFCVNTQNLNNPKKQKNIPRSRDRERD